MSYAWSPKPALDLRPYPVVTLAETRAKALDKRRAIEKGMDRYAQRRHADVRAGGREGDRRSTRGNGRGASVRSSGGSVLRRSIRGPSVSESLSLVPQQDREGAAPDPTP